MQHRCVCPTSWPTLTADDSRRLARGVERYFRESPSACPEAQGV
jgi:hypothetical protein